MRALSINSLTLSRWSKVNTRFGSPLNAQLCVTVIVALLGCIYLGSSTAFNAMMSSAVYVTRFVPSIKANKLDQHHQQHRISGSHPDKRDPRSPDDAQRPLLHGNRRRHDGQHHHHCMAGVCHCVLFIPILHAGHRYDSQNPSSSLLHTDQSLTCHSASNMNYTCACVGGFLLIELMWWLVAGKRYSQSMQKAREEEQNAARAVIVHAEDKT